MRLLTEIALLIHHEQVHKLSLEVCYQLPTQLYQLTICEIIISYACVFKNM